MAEYIGIAAALELGEKMGGEDFYLPKLDNVLARRRYKLIKADLASGLSYKHIERFMLSATPCDIFARTHSRLL